MADSDRKSPTGLTHGEAKEFHGLMVSSTLVFVGLTLVAHFLIWNWRPWF